MTTTDETKARVEEAMAQDPEAKKVARAEALAQSRQAKMDSLFKGKKFEIIKRVDLPEGQQFQTRLGNKGRHGFIICQVDKDGNRVQGQPDSEYGTAGKDDVQIVGETTLKVIHETYKGITKAQLDEAFPPKAKKEPKAKADKPESDAIDPLSLV